MTTYTAWYLTIAALLHGQVTGVKHSGPTGLVSYFTGATNILYTFGGHAVTVEIMHEMWKPQKFKYIYLFATIYVFTLTLPSAASVYWAFGDQLLTHSNSFSLLPRSGWRDAGVILMLIHQNAVEKPPFFVRSWTAVYAMNTFAVVWVLVVGFGLGGWASLSNFIRQVDSFGLFAKCYQCPLAPPLGPNHWLR